jgi:hypothetical protein
METRLVRFPVTCPRCGSESLIQFRSSAVSVALTEWRSMRLYTPCHDLFWDASDLELEQIGEYFGITWLGGHPSHDAGLHRAGRP